MNNRVVRVGDMLDGHDDRKRIITEVRRMSFSYKFKDPSDTKWYSCPYSHLDFRNSDWDVIPAYPDHIRLPAGL